MKTQIIGIILSTALLTGCATSGQQTKLEPTAPCATDGQRTKSEAIAVIAAVGTAIGAGLGAVVGGKKGVLPGAAALGALGAGIGYVVGTHIVRTRRQNSPVKKTIWMRLSPVPDR